MGIIFVNAKRFIFIFAAVKMVIVAQLVRAPDCGSGGRGFESHHSPIIMKPARMGWFFYFINYG